MTDKFDDHLDVIESVLQPPHNYQHIDEAISNIRMIKAPSKKQLHRVFKILYSQMLKDVSKIKWNDSDFGRPEWYAHSNSITKFENIIENKRRPKLDIPWNADECFDALLPYFEWIKQNNKQFDHSHYSISWNVILNGQPPIQSAFKKHWQYLEADNLTNKNTFQHFELAKQLHNKVDNTDNITADDFYNAVELLDHPNSIVRGVAAKLLGTTYFDWLYDDEFCGNDEIAITEMLELLYKKQVAGKCVVGGFVDGHNADVSKFGFSDLEHNKFLIEQNFNLKEWVIQTAIDSPGNEPNIPCSTAFWFYVHEYLDFDPKSVERLIQGKRHWLAMMCATESYPDSIGMKPILEKLVEVAEPQIAEHCQNILNIHTDLL